MFSLRAHAERHGSQLDHRYSSSVVNPLLAQHHPRNDSLNMQGIASPDDSCIPDSSMSARLSQVSERPLVNRQTSSWEHLMNGGNRPLAQWEAEEGQPSVSTEYTQLPRLRHVNAFHAHVRVVEAPALQRGFSHRAEIGNVLLADCDAKEVPGPVPHTTFSSFPPDLDIQSWQFELTELPSETPKSPSLVRRPATRRCSRSGSSVDLGEGDRSNLLSPRLGIGMQYCNLNQRKEPRSNGLLHVH